MQRFTCPKCNGLGGWGAFGPCGPQDVHHRHPCKGCNGNGFVMMAAPPQPCSMCQGKGGHGPFGPCSEEDVHYKSPCKPCGGNGFLGASMGGGMGGMGGMGGGNIIINQVDMDVNVVGGNMVNTEVEVGQQPMGNMNMMNSGMGQQPMGGNMMNGMGMNGMGQQHLMGGNMPMMNGMGQQGNMMNGMGMNGMGRGNMMNGMGMNGMGRGNMMNGMGMNGMGGGNMMNGMGMNGMGPQMNGMGQQMNGMGQHNPQMMNQQMYGQQQPYRPYGRTRGLPDGEEGAEGDDAAEVQAEVAALRADSENTGPLITDEQLLAEFKLLDVNLNGYLEKDEFLEVYKKYDPLYEECEGTIHKMLQGYNMMGDDKVSYDEFCLIMLKLAQK